MTTQSNPKKHSDITEVEVNARAVGASHAAKGRVSLVHSKQHTMDITNLTQGQD